MYGEIKQLTIVIYLIFESIVTAFHNTAKKVEVIDNIHYVNSYTPNYRQRLHPSFRIH